MPNKFASGKFAIAQCDICGFRYKLKQLKGLVIKTKNVNILACPECWNPDQPQLQLGMWPVDDPQAVRNPRPDSNSYYQSGYNGMQTVDNVVNTNPLYTGVPLEGSRTIEWGFNPVGGARSIDAGMTPNHLIGQALLNSVTVS